MLKVIYIVFFVFIINCSAYALEVKLECDISAKRNYSTGTVKNEKGLAIVEVVDNGKYIRISTNSNVMILNNVGVTTLPRDDLAINDFSNKNKWDISNIVNDSSVDGLSYKLTNQIKIDRNSGFITYYSVFEDSEGIETSEASGKCKKINTSVKKF